MTEQTRFHRHWHVRVTRDSLVYNLLRKPLLVLSDKHKDYVEKSRLVFGVRVSKTDHHDEYTLTPLGLLHGLTGMTLIFQDPWDALPDAPEDDADPRWHHSLTKEEAWCAWPCDHCGGRRDEHADQNIQHPFSEWDIADHKFRA